MSNFALLLALLSHEKKEDVTFFVDHTVVSVCILAESDWKV